MAASELPFGLATSVGPVPTDDVAQAVDVALAAHPGFPTVPVLRTPTRSLVAQAVSGIAGISVAPPGLLRIDDPDSVVPDDVDGAGTDLTGPEFEATHEFLARLSTTAGPVDRPTRVGVLGPVTLTLSLVAAGLPIPMASKLAVALTTRRAVALLEAVRAATPRGVIVVVLSEPGLIGGMHPTFPLSPMETRALLDPVIDALDLAPSAAGGLLIGIHVPGRADWETIISSGVSMISAPADSGLVGWSELVGYLLDRGGWICWGAVPVDQPLGTSEEMLWRRLSGVWCDLAAAGVDPIQLRMQSMVSPADGLGHFGLSQAERVLGLVETLSTRVQRQTVGARLTVGA